MLSMGRPGYEATFAYFFLFYMKQKKKCLLGHSNKIHCFTGNPARNIGSVCIFFIINYCHHMIAIETMCFTNVASLIASLSFEAASKTEQNGQQYHRPWQN